MSGDPAMREPGRVLTAMATPFATDGSLDREGAARFARHLVATGTETVVVSGTTGESPSLTFQEKFELFDIVKDAVGSQAPVMMGTGTYSTAESIELTVEAERRGADSVLLVAPYYNRPPQEGLYRHFRTIAESTRLPVMLYNVPTRTVTDLLPDTIVRLAEIPNIFAVKEASGQVTRTAEILARARRGFRVYSGDDVLTLPILSMGGYGVVSVASNVAGCQIQGLVEAFWRGDAQQAAALHQALLPLFKALFITTSPIPLKAALKLLGLPGGAPRLPLVEATTTEVDIVREALYAVKRLPREVASDPDSSNH